VIHCGLGDEPPPERSSDSLESWFMTFRKRSARSARRYKSTPATPSADLLDTALFTMQSAVRSLASAEWCWLRRLTERCN